MWADTLSDVITADGNINIITPNQRLALVRIALWVSKQCLSLAMTRHIHHSHFYIKYVLYFCLLYGSETKPQTLCQ